MSVIATSLSPTFPYVSGAPNGLQPFVSASGIAGRLIQQEGTQGSKDEFNMSVVSVPFKVFAGANWSALLPTRGDSITGFPNLVVWDPLLTYTIGKAWVDLKIMLRGLTSLNGVSTDWNGYTLNPKPVDSVGIATAQISGTDGKSTATVTFSRPQSVFRFVATTSSPSSFPTAINDAYDPMTNPGGRAVYILGYRIELANGDEEGGSGNVTGFNLGIRTRAIAWTNQQIGNFWQHEVTLAREAYDTAGGS